MRRRLLRILAAISLLIWLAVAVAWPVSYRWSIIYCPWLPSATNVALFPGQISVSVWPDELSTWNNIWDRPVTVIPASGGASLLTASRDRDGIDVFGIVWQWQTTWTDLNGGTAWINPDQRNYALPFWLLLIVFAWPIIPWIKHRRRTFTRIGLCKSCGYDLRATAERCPECGAVPMAASAKTGG